MPSGLSLPLAFGMRTGQNLGMERLVANEIDAVKLVTAACSTYGFVFFFPKMLFQLFL